MRQERVKNYKKYWPGTTSAEALAKYDDLFASQRGKCAICDGHQDDFKHALVVDHCHKTGKVRGLLCQECNLGIGKLKDSVENVQRACTYLKAQDS